MAPKTALAFRPISELQSLLREGAVTPHDILDSVLLNIRRKERKVHAYLHLMDEAALRNSADEAERALKRGRPRALCGIPMAMKDNTDVAGMPCTGGSRILAGFVPQADANVALRLRREGVTFLGKTNLDELAAFGVATNNPHFGRTYNPWNLNRIPGGSSGGSAAAVAAGESVAALGTDTGGSVRLPASFCGVTGLKPTYGRIGRSGTIGMSWSLDHVGTITRTARDAGLLLGILAGEDPEDISTAHTPPYEKPVYTKEANLRGVRVGVLSNHICPYEEEVESVFTESVALLSSLGAAVSDVRLPDLEHVTPSIFAIALAENSSYHEDWLKSSSELYGDALKSYVQLGFTVLATQYLKAQRARSVISQSVSRALADVDVLAMPTAPTIAPELTQETVEIRGKSYPALQVLTENTYPVNFLGLPAISVPNGFVGRMPTGLQLVAKSWREKDLLKVAEAYQASTTFHQAIPE